MSYEPTEWKAGDVVTSAKLNKLENAVAKTGSLIVNMEEVGNSYVLDKEYGEIREAYVLGKHVLIQFPIFENDVATGASITDAFEITEKQMKTVPPSYQYEIIIRSTLLDKLAGESFVAHVMAEHPTWTDHGK